MESRNEKGRHGELPKWTEVAGRVSFAMSISLSRDSRDGSIGFRRPRLAAELQRRQLDTHCRHFVQPAASAMYFVRGLAGIPAARRGIYLAAGPWIHSRRKTGGLHVEISNQARNADTVFGGSDRFTSIRSGVCRGGGGDPPSANPPPPPDRSAPKSSSKSKKKPAKQSSVDDAAFRQGYRAAHATIYQRNDYAAAIEQLKALGHDDNAGVANLIGYSYRKLGDYKLSQDLVRARAEGGSEPRADLAVLRPVADRAGQSRPGVVPSQPDRGDLRHRLRRISVVGRGARKAARHRTRLIERCDRAGRAR